MTAVLSGVLSLACAAPLDGVEKEIKPADLESLKATGAKANGLVVWTSSRAGLPHLFTMKTDGSDIRQITKGEGTDFHPRFSPDGLHILFSRSRDDGFVRESEASNSKLWDLYVVNSSGGDLKLVAEHATWGSWIGPEEISFLRGSRIMRSKLGGENETRVMDLAKHAFFDGATIVQPEVSHDGHFVAVGVGGKHRQVGIWSVKKKTWEQLGTGTQIGWAADGASVCWADDAGKEGRIEHEPVVAGTPADDRDPAKLVVVDLPGKRSREAFPRLSNDGKWVVFAAAIGSLENDLEDFELYLAEVGGDTSHATRLTFHSSNDRWPDIFVGEPGRAAAPAAADEAGEREAGEGEDAQGENAEKAPKAEKAKAEPAGEEAAPTDTTTEKKAEPATDEAAAPEEAAPKAPAPKGKKKKKR